MMNIVLSNHLKKLSKIHQAKGIAGVFAFLFGRLIVRRMDTIVYKQVLSKLSDKPHWRSNEKFILWDKDTLISKKASVLSLLDPDAALELMVSVKSGDYAYTVIVDNTVAHSGMVMIRSKQNAILRESSGIPLIGYCHTHPKYRKQGLYTRGLRSAVMEIRRRGYEYAIIEANPLNKYSNLGIRKAGFVKHRSMRGFILFHRLCLFTISIEGQERTEFWMI